MSTLNGYTFTLPTELLDNILAHLSSRDLFQCLTVSKVWHHNAVRNLFISPSIKRAEAITQFLRYLMRHNDKALTVRGLNISVKRYHTRDQFDLTSAVHLLHMLPNLRHLRQFPIPVLGQEHCIQNITELNLVSLHVRERIILPGGKAHTVTFDQFYPVLARLVNIKALTLSDMAGAPSADLYLPSSILPRLEWIQLIKCRELHDAQLERLFQSFLRFPIAIYINHLRKLSPIGLYTAIFPQAHTITHLSLKGTFNNSRQPSVDPAFLSTLPRLLHLATCTTFLPRTGLMHIPSTLQELETSACAQLTAGYMLAGLQKWSAVRDGPKKLKLSRHLYTPEDIYDIKVGHLPIG